MDRTTESMLSLAARFRSVLSIPGQKQPAIITSHASPDGDAVASILAASEILRMLGVEPVCVIEGGVPPRFQFMEDAEKINSSDSLKGTQYKQALVVDSANKARIGNVNRLFTDDAFIINIDHHADNSLFGSLNIVYPEAASTTEILYDLSAALDLDIDKTMAEYLYTGLLTDTGRFRFSNTTARTFDIASALVSSGAQPNEISKHIYSSNSIKAMRLIGEALSSLEIYADNRVAVMTIHPPSDSEEPEELAEYTLKIKDVRATALFRIIDGTTRVSLRGRGDYNVAQIARKFGGGGHPKAAGFTSDEKPDVIRKQVIEALIQEVEKDSPGSA